MSHKHPYEDAVDASQVSMDMGRVNKVATTFLKQQKNGQFPGGQLVVRRKGRVVLNVSCGIARGWQGRGGEEIVSVSENTPFAVFSTGKPMAAVIIALLESRGLLDISAPVSRYLPEFGTLGREKITVSDVLTHRAGILLTDLINRPGLIGDAEAVWQYLLETPPLYPRGTFAYMPTEYGMILDQLALSVTGKRMVTLFKEELAVPLGLDNIHYGLGPHPIDDIAWNYWQGKARYMVAGMDVAEGFEEKNNSHDLFSAGNSAISMVADAASLAVMYEFLVNGGRSHDGVQIIDESLVDRYTRKRTSGWNRTIKTYLSLGNGFMLGTPTPSFYGWWGSSNCFGHPGMFSSMAFADHDTKLSMAIVTNGNRSIGDFFMRMAPLAHTMRSACQ